MDKDYLVLKRASASRSSGEWSDDDYDVLARRCRGRPHLEVRRRPRGDAVALDAGLRPPRRSHAHLRLRADARGRHGGVREELAAAGAAMRMRGSRRLSRTNLWPNPTSQTAPSPPTQGALTFDCIWCSV